MRNKFIFASLAICSLFLSLVPRTTLGQEDVERTAKIRSKYAKYEYQIPMRDGKKLFTACYVPYDASPTNTYPILMVRSPYSSGPYGIDQYRTSLGINEDFEDSGYIFVYQDVRGCYMSEGEFVNMRPHIEGKRGKQVDESSDTYDTIEWLLKHVQHNNGRVGQWGISYPGFYTSAGAIDSHPALKAISPQAPISDWFWDDMHRNGAFNVQLAFTFFSSFGKSRPEPTTERGPRFDFGTQDSYQFFLDLGPLQNVNKRYLNGSIPFWNAITEHPNYDEFWQSRNILPHLRNIRCASLVVGGWFDTEDLYGPLKTYQSIEDNNPDSQNYLVMGPWYHGGWNRSDGDSLGDARFDWATAEWYRKNVEFPFFEQHLKDAPAANLAEATVFETGANRWRKFESWPPPKTAMTPYYFSSDQELKADPLSEQGRENSGEQSDSFPSDPNKPVPYTMEITSRWSRDYMAEDQRFAARRPDVLVYRSPVLEEDVTVAGAALADLWFSTTGSDADLVVKLVDEFPGTLKNGQSEKEDFQSGRQQLVRGQVMRLRFRDSFEEPKPMTPNKPEQVKIELNDVLHTFKRGHRIMIQIQSSWFPFIDRNPQSFVDNIFEAEENDFIRATHTLHRSQQYPSLIQLPIHSN